MLLPGRLQPDNYDPPFFRSCGQEEQLTWSDTPLKMKVGDIDAKHFTMALKVRPDPAALGLQTDQGVSAASPPVPI